MKKILATLLLSICTVASAQTEPRCAPSSAADIRSGTVDNGVWFYWWCRDSTHVWVNWQGFTPDEMKKFVYTGAITRQLSADPVNNLLIWGKYEMRPELASLEAAVIAASTADTNKPSPGAPYPLPKLDELWNVTPNGQYPTRKTNLVVDGKVTGTYGSQNVKILTPCDCSVVKYPEGSMTQKCPLAGKAITEVISCIRLR